MPKSQGTKGIQLAAAICLLTALSGCMLPSKSSTTYRISREESISFLRTGLPDLDQDGIPNAEDPDANGDGQADQEN